MVNPQELRLGNWIAKKEDNSPVQVYSLDGSTINGLAPEHFEPLKLTGEQLLNGGFKYNGAVYCFKEKIELCFDLQQNEYVTIDDRHGGQALLERQFHFLHEVQNLIFGMISIELPITL